jgi:mono/diheme cytochrome c family protein
MNKQTVILGAVVLLSCMLPGCVHAPNTELGKQEFVSKCATCHGLGGKGDGPQAIITKPADLTILAKKNGGVFPAQRVHEIIDGRREVAAHGPRTMPVWGMLFQVDLPDVPDEATGIINYRETTVSDRIQAIIDYLKTLQDMN